LLARLKAAAGVDIPPAVFLRDPTIDGLVRAIQDAAYEGDVQTVVPLQPNGRRRPLFFVVPGPPWALADLARRLAPEQPLYAVHPLALVRPTWRPEVAELASAYVGAIREVQPRGPYLLAGESSSGKVALEMAQQLIGDGETVSLVVLVDTPLKVMRFSPFQGFHGRLNRCIGYAIEALTDGSAEGRTAFLEIARELSFALPFIRRLRRTAFGRSPDVQDAVRYVLDLVKAQHGATHRYQMRPYPGRIAYFWAEKTPLYTVRDPRRGWEDIAQGAFELHRVPGRHHHALLEPNVRVLAREMKAVLAKAQRDAGAQSRD
jgi:thioesterase domain-containing protein